MDFRPHAQPGILKGFCILLALVAAGLIGHMPVAAQTYSCFPTCDENDGRLLTIAGQGFSTIINESVVLKMASAAGQPNIEFGIFDGETGNSWDFGSTPLVYTLYADPDGDGTGDVQLWQRNGAEMLDDDWKTYTLENFASARAPNGNYLYALVIRTSDTTAHYWSSFKVRTTTGTLALKAQAFTISASARTLGDFQTLFPNTNFSPQTFNENDLATDPTTYDGSWNLFLDVNRRGQMLDIWDGDLDHGNYNCTVMDTDDPNTPNNTLPPWADPNVVQYEGVASGLPCTGGTGMGTGTPPDDNLRLAFRREPSIWYRVVDPQNNVYPNSNPSGDREWELFRIATAQVNAASRDAVTDSLPPGIYAVNIIGMDVQNLNGWRFFFDALGVDANGDPTPPLEPFSIGGTICTIEQASTGTTASNGNNGRGRGRGNRGNDDASESSGGSACNGINNVRVVVEADYDMDDVIDEFFVTTTDADGEYRVGNLPAGRYQVIVDVSTLPSGLTPADDYDGISTPNRAVVVLSNTAPENVFFQYEAQGSTGGGCPQIRSQGYWSTHSSEWPLTSLRLGSATYTKSRALEIMNNPSRGDKSIDLAVQLIAAKLNVANDGCGSSCIASTIAEADQWLRDNGGVGSGINGSSRAWRNEGEALKNALDAFNNGNGCSSSID